MKNKIVGILLSAVLLTACGGGNETQSVEPQQDPAALVFSYPADAQRNVSPVADVVLRFSEAVDPASISENVVVGMGNIRMPFSVRSVDEGKSVVLSFPEPLATGADFEVIFENPVRTVDGAQIPNPIMGNNDQPGIQFSTRAGFTGVAELDSTAQELSIRSVVPSNGTPFEPSDLAAFRLELSQTIDPQWQEKGGSIRLMDAAGEAVPVNILVNNRLITIDPCTTADERQCGSPDDQLVGGMEYSLEITNLPALTGQRLTETRTFNVRESEPTAVQFQNVTDPGITEGGPVLRSSLNGQAVNGIVLNSVLQGTTEQSESLGGLYTELAFAPSFAADEALPLRIPRGSQLFGSSLPVRINGTVPVIDEKTQVLQQTGNINIVMVSDATGYLLPNPYTSNQDAPKHVRLFMDVSMNAERAQPNAALSQDLLHVELVGTALVEDGILTIDALSIVEPNLLGQEVTNATLAFQITANTDVDVQFEAIRQRAEDTEGPQLVSWQPGEDQTFPGDKDQIQRPGDPVTLFYDEPLVPHSAAQGITVYEGGQEVPAAIFVDGTTVTINPEGGLKHGMPYTIAVDNDLTDLAGNSVTPQSLQFELPDLGDAGSVERVSPLPLTTYPGYPCVTTGVDLQADNHGRCTDDAPNGPLGDVLPITRMPSDRPIVVVFSKSIDLATVRLNDTFVVERLDENGEVLGNVDGRLELNNQRIRFFPDAPWQPGAAYRYTLASNTSSNCSDAICSEEGLPIQTDLLVDPNDIGGPDLAIVFKGKAPIGAVYTPLRNFPVRDANSNYEVDCDSLAGRDCLEPFDHDADPVNGQEFLPSENTAKLVVRDNENASALGIPLRASVGCAPGESCPESKFIYQTFALNTEVVGPVDPTDPGSGVSVLLYPTALAGTSSSVFLDAFGEQATGTTILRMRYEPRTEDNPEGLIPGRIFEGPDGGTRFETVARLYLDGPNLRLPAAQLLEHDLYSKEITLKLEGPIRFFDDGRMQVSLLSVEAIPLDVNVDIVLPLVSDAPVVGDLLNLVTDDLLTEVGNIVDGLACLLNPECNEPSRAEGTVNIPLEIPTGGINLNFVSFPIKQLPIETNSR